MSDRNVASSDGRFMVVMLVLLLVGLTESSADSDGMSFSCERK